MSDAERVDPTGALERIRAAHGRRVAQGGMTNGHRFSPEEAKAIYGRDIYADADAHRRSARQAEWSVVIPSRYQWATLEGASTTPENRQRLAEWAEMPRAQNLLLVGNVGVGKTWSAVAACRPPFDRGMDVMFKAAVDLLDDLRPDGPRDALEEAREVDLLVLDDLGAERPTDWTAERLYAIVNWRWMQERPTVATSNLAPADLHERVGERMWSRLVGSEAVVVGLDGTDRRFG